MVYVILKHIEDTTQIIGSVSRYIKLSIKRILAYCREEGKDYGSGMGERQHFQYTRGIKLTGLQHAKLSIQRRTGLNLDSRLV